MKKTIKILVIVMLFSTAKLSAQELPKLTELYSSCSECSDPNILIYDFSCKHFYYKGSWVKNPSKLFAEYNEEFKIKVVNVNRYMYNVGVSVDNIEFGSEPPELFNQLFIGKGSYLDGLIENVTTKNAELKIIADPDKGVKSTFYKENDSFKDLLVDFKNLYNNLLNSQLKAYSFCKQTFECCEDKDPVDFVDVTQKLTELKFAYQIYMEELEKELKEIDNQIETAQKELDSLKVSKADLETILKNEKKPAYQQILKDQIKKIELDYLAEEERLNEMKEGKIGKELKKSETQNLWKPISEITDKDLMKLVLFNNNLVPNHFSYTSPPIYPKNNMLSFGIKISPVDSSLTVKWNNMPLYNDSFGIDIRVRNKWSLTFSSGPFFGIGKSVQNENYAWQPQPINGVIEDSSKYKLAKNGNALLPLGLAAFANIAVKHNNYFGSGISIGVGIAIEPNPKPAYFLGYSLMFGEKQQLNFTFGALLKHVDKLNTDFYINKETTLYSEKPSEIEYSKSFNAGAFISLSYTLNSIIRNKTVNSKSN